MNKSTAFMLAMVALMSLVVASCEQATTPSARPDQPGVRDPLSEWSATHFLRYIQNGELRETSFSDELGTWAEAECRYRAYVAEHGSGVGFNELTDDTACGSIGQPTSDNFCRQSLCTLVRNSCSANLGMELAQSTGRVTWLEWRPEEERVVWLVQTTADRALAAYWAGWWVRLIEDFAGQAGPSSFADATDCGMAGWPNGPNGQHQGTVLDRLGAELADQYAILREANEASSRYLSASADASITGRWPNIEFLTDDDSAVSLRRLAASGLVPLTLDAGLHNDEFCPASTGEPSVDAAIRLIRLSALDPHLVIGAEGDDPSLRSFGQMVMARVARLRGAFVPTESLESFLQREGTDLTGLLAARERLASELVVLRRSMTQLLPEVLPRFDEDPEDFDVRLYASTRTEPTTYLPVANLLGVLDGHDSHDPVTEFGLPYWWGSHGGLLLDQEEWWGIDWSSSQVNIAQIFHEFGSLLVARGDATPDPELAENFQRVGSATQRLAALDVAGTAVVGSYLFDSDEGEEAFSAGQVAAAYSGNELILVRTVDAVQCATTGRIESVPCDWADVGALDPQAISFEAYRALDPTRPGESVNERAAYAAAHAGRQFVRWVPPPPVVDWEEVRDGDPPSISPRPLFILERLAGHSARVPGAYRVWSLIYQQFEDNDEGDPERLYRAAVSPGLLADAASLVAPSTADCSRPANFCAATGLDGTDRVALENALTDNGNDVEDSWQRYLALARAAADQADALGERALADVQSIDERAESAAAELENICGVTVDPDELAEAFRTSSASTLVDVLRGMPGSAAARLVRCLGGERIIPYVGLGTSPVCLYHPTGRPWELCEIGRAPAPGEELPECPRVVGDVAECTAALFGFTGADLTGVETDDVPADRMLKFFTAPTTGAGRPATETLCGRVRELHTAIENGDPPPVAVMQAFAAEPFFVPGNLSEFARKIRWEAEPQNHSTVYIGDTAVLSTGSPWGGHPSLVATPRPDYCQLSAQRESLFCEQVPPSRYYLNSRLAGAATIARWLGGESYVDFVVPYYAGSEDAVPNRDARTPANYRLSQDTGPSGHYPDAQWLVDFRATATGRTEESYTCWDRPGLGSLAEGDIWRWMAVFPGETPWSNDPVNQDCGRIDPDLQRAVVFERLTGVRAYGEGGSIRAVEVDVDRRRAELFLERMLVPMGSPHSFWTQLRDIADGSGGTRVTTSCHEYNANTQQIVINDTYARCYQDGFGNGDTWPMWIDGDSDATTDGDVRDLQDYLVPNQGTLFPYVGGVDIHYRTVLDAMELLCAAGLEGAGEIDFSSETEEVHTLDDVYILERNLQRAADRYRRLGSRIVMTDMPQDVFEALSETGTAVGVAPDGQYGANLVSTRNAVVGLATLPDELATEIEGMARDMRAVSDEVRRLNLGTELDKNQFASTMSGQLARCLSATANAVGLGQAANWGTGAAVAVTCADSIAQIALAARALKVKQDINGIDEGLALLRFEEKASQRMVRVTSVGRRLVEGTNALNAALTNLEALRLDGRRALERMAFVGHGEGELAYYANTNLQRRYNTSRLRYERAHERAVQAAYLARLAIEQRVGADLNSFGDDLTLVEAPVTWADSLCATVGFDAENVRDPSDPDFNVYADAYIGEYVSKLEQFMASYSNDFPFGGGSDVAVVSLRDDVNQTRGWCDVETRNLLYHTADIAGPATEPDGTLGWSATGCLEDTEGEVLPNCVTATTLGGPDDAVGVGNASFGTLVPTRLTFGLLCDQLSCGWQAGVRYAQTLVGNASGKQRVSWYGRGPGASGAVQVRNLASGSVVVPTTVHFAPVSETSPWTHYWYDVSFATPTSIAVEIRPATEVAGAVVDIAGLMLEEVPGSSVSSDEPRFTSTSANRTLSVQQCEDTNGIVFRQQGWTRHCRRVCPGGTSVTCDEGESYDECYWETQFDVSQRDIARGTLFGNGGFARGNFNYRIQSLAVNFVGSAARTCENSSNPSTCYNAGFIHYSLEHEGPYLVENYFGDSYSAPVFVGRINYARGLAAERHLSNPVSESLIGQYTRSELRGRPLTGTYKIRVHDGPGVNFEGIEDVQLLVGYDYWTRQN